MDDERMARWLLQRQALCWCRAAQRFVATHGFEHAGNLAFLGLLALFPFLIFLLNLAGFFGQTEAGQQAIALLMENLPPRIAEAIARPISNTIARADEGLLTGAILFALWVSINGLEAARLTVIEAFRAWPHAMPLWKRMSVNLLLVLVAAVLILAAMSLLVLLPVALETAERWFSLPAHALELGRLVHHVIAPLLILAAVYGGYRLFTPAVPGLRRRYLPGTVWTLAAWWASAKAVALFLSHAERYDILYGSLAGIVLTQLFFFFLAASFIFGAHLNAVYSPSDGGEDDGPVTRGH